MEWHGINYVIYPKNVPLFLDSAEPVVPAGEFGTLQEVEASSRP